MSEPQPRVVGNVFETPRACGPCTLCCKLYDIAELQKPEDSWCRHCDQGVGCTIYPGRPEACRDFQCVWTFAAPLDERWRPDQCGFVMRPGLAGEVVIDVDPVDPDAWKREPFYSQIKTWSVRRQPPHRMYIVRAGGRMAVVFPEGEVDLGPERRDEPIESGYRLIDGRQQPFAHFVPPGLRPKPS